MPPSLALLLTTAFVLFLFWRDTRERPAITGALWIPLLWILIIGSRYFSEWLSLEGAGDAAAGLVDGSPWDRALFLSLELAGLVVLFRRRVSLSGVVSQNLWMAVFLAYAALAIAWSDFPLVAFKRWVKVLDHPIMVLIVATEPDPREALIRLFKRAAYVLVPFSIMLIKYYPELGRRFSMWDGTPMNTGVTTNKNLLGSDCLVLGYFFFWHFLTTMRSKTGAERRRDLVLDGAFLGMTGWLLVMADSATSLMALLVGVATLLFLGLRLVNARYVAVYIGATLLVYTCAEFAFDATDFVIRSLGRDATLTGRTELWTDVLNSGVNPLLGAGFESFWLGKRLEVLWAKHWWHPNQAHNGYIETYLNLGWIGVGFLAAWITSAFWRARDTLLSDFAFGRFRLGVVASVVVYNYTEATFKALHLIWFVFFIATTEYFRTRLPPPPLPPRDTSFSRRAHETESFSNRPAYFRHPACRRETGSRSKSDMTFSWGGRR